MGKQNQRKAGLVKKLELVYSFFHNSIFLRKSYIPSRRPYLTLKLNQDAPISSK